MSQKPQLLLKVNNLEQSIGFHTKIMGWNLVWEEERVARLDLEEGEPASLLIDKANIDTTPYLESVYSSPKIGERFYMTKSGLEAF